MLLGLPFTYLGLSPAFGKLHYQRTFGDSLILPSHNHKLNEEVIAAGSLNPLGATVYLFSELLSPIPY